MRIVLSRNEFVSTVATLRFGIANLLAGETADKVSAYFIDYDTVANAVAKADGCIRTPEGMEVSILPDGSICVRYPEEMVVKSQEQIMQVVTIWAPVVKMATPFVNTVVVAAKQLMVAMKQLMSKELKEALKEASAKTKALKQ